MALRAVGWALLVCAAATPSLGAEPGPANGAAAKADDALLLDVDVSLMSDYIYRGVSLSTRRPSAATAVEARWHDFYVNTNVQSVALPTNPVAEVTLTGGYRWDPGIFTLDVNATYFWYPGETLLEGMPATSYAEYAASIERKFSPVTVKGLVAYSPNVSGTGAWGAYTEGVVEIELPKFGEVEWQLNASAGYWRLGNVSPMLGGFPLPSYANWHIGLVFTFQDHLTFDLSYWDTSLSKEDCFVFTGDTTATPGGIANAASNPDGLRSRLCGAALVGTLTVKFEDIKIGK